MTLPVHKYGDPVLRVKADRVEKVDQGIRSLVDELLRTMYAEHGVGLAAEQVGRTEAVCVVDVSPEGDSDAKGARLNPDVPMPLVLVNPEIVEASRKTEVGEEGCLSFPGIYASVSRPCEVRVKFLDRDGKPQEQTVRGLVARAVQHEMDHLEGVLIVDRMSYVKKIALGGQLKRLKRETQSKLAPAADPA